VVPLPREAIHGGGGAPQSRLMVVVAMAAIEHEVEMVLLFWL
jgi:hypothetical protein